MAQLDTLETALKIVYTRYDMPTGKYNRKPRGNYRDPVMGFWNKTIKTPDCWNWIANKDKDGYGVYNPYRKSVRAHRYSYELVNGKIPDGMVIDHLCRNTSCVRPSHMEAVTSRENILRGIAPPAVNSAKTHCKSGHELLGENLYVQPKTQKRYCRTCDRRRGAAYELRKRQEASKKNASSK